MNLSELFKDKSIKPKERTELLTAALLDGSLLFDELSAYFSGARDQEKAFLLEAMEAASAKDATVSTKDWFNLSAENINHKSPSVKREAARVVGNLAALYPDFWRARFLR